MKIRLKNIQNKNRQKSHLLTNYVRNALVVEEAFKVIKEGSGITNIDEIVTAFIKAEEQNYALWNYVNQLSRECDLYEERMSLIDKDIARYEAMANMNNTERRFEKDDHEQHWRGQRCPGGVRRDSTSGSWIGQEVLSGSLFDQGRHQDAV